MCVVEEIMCYTTQKNAMCLHLYKDVDAPNVAMRAAPATAVSTSARARRPYAAHTAQKIHARGNRYRHHHQTSALTATPPHHVLGDLEINSSTLPSA